MAIFAVPVVYCTTYYRKISVVRTRNTEVSKRAIMMIPRCLSVTRQWIQERIYLHHSYAAWPLLDMQEPQVCEITRREAPLNRLYKDRACEDVTCSPSIAITRKGPGETSLKFHYLGLGCQDGLARKLQECMVLKNAMAKMMWADLMK